jgi:heme/copper-type cytochrome/quinol oxidase subunit 2
VGRFEKMDFKKMIEFAANTLINIVYIGAILLYYNQDRSELNFLKRISWLIIPVVCVICIFQPTFYVYSIRDLLISTFILYYITFKNEMNNEF